MNLENYHLSFVYILSTFVGSLHAADSVWQQFCVVVTLLAPILIQVLFRFYDHSEDEVWILCRLCSSAGQRGTQLLRLVSFRVIVTREELFDL